jgi:hypothetical protein
MFIVMTTETKRIHNLLVHCKSPYNADTCRGALRLSIFLTGRTLYGKWVHAGSDICILAMLMTYSTTSWGAALRIPIKQTNKLRGL